jgi:CRISPR system Cascade subunit CasE
MFLSRFEINTARRAARNLLASPQSMHAAVLAAFPPGQAHDDGGRVLWRLDTVGHQVTLYLVSPDKPDLTHLVESVGWPTTQGWDTRDYQQLLDGLRAGDRWAFRLTANPVSSRRKTTTSQHSQRFGYVTVAQQTEWLLDRAPRHGFALAPAAGDEPDVAVRARRTWRFTRKGADVTLSTAVFEGHLDIRDLDLLRRALTSGIGHAKGYGCGLLTLAPVRRA